MLEAARRSRELDAPLLSQAVGKTKDDACGKGIVNIGSSGFLVGSTGWVGSQARASNDSPPSLRKIAVVKYSTLRNPLAALLMDCMSEFAPSR